MRVVEIRRKHRYCVYYNSFEFTSNDLGEYREYLQVIATEIKNGYSDVFQIFEKEIIITYLAAGRAKCETKKYFYKFNTIFLAIFGAGVVIIFLLIGSSVCFSL